jgi:hypothetical protein
MLAVAFSKGRTIAPLSIDPVAQRVDGNSVGMIITS